MICGLDFENNKCEKDIQKKVFIELYVKVNKNWRSDKIQLKRFGYNQK